MLEKIKKIFLYALLVYGFLGSIILPFVLKPQLIKVVQNETNSKITIDSIRFNPFLFKLKLSGVELSSLDDKPLISFDSLLIDIELYSLLRSAIHIHELTLNHPKIHVVYNRDKTINLLGILKPTQEVKRVESNETAAVPRIIIDTIEVVDGYVNYEDYTQQSKFDFSFGNIGFELKDIDTNDFNTSSAELRFYSHLGDGGFVDFKSKIEGFKPFVVNGSLDFEASKLYSQWKYMQDSLNLEVADGKISFHAEYHLNLDDLNATTIENLNVSLEKLRVKPKSKYKDVLNLGSLYIQNATIKPMARRVHVERIGLDSLNIKVKRDENSKIDWLEYIKMQDSGELVEGEETQVESNVTSLSSAPWDVLVDDVIIEKIAIDFNDEAVKPTVQSKLNEFNFYAQNITLAGEQPFGYQLNMLVNDGAKCSSDGKVIHSVLDVQTYLECSEFNIAHYRPYIDQAASTELKVFDLKLQNAVAGFKAKVKVKDIQKEIVINVDDANLSLTELELRKRSSDEKLVNFSSFNVDGVKLNTLEKTVDVQKVSLNGLDIKTARLEDGTLNIQDIVVPKTSKKISKKNKSTDEKEYSVKLKHFAIDAAQVSFNDKALKPSVKSKLDRFFLNAYDIDLKKNSWLKYRFYMRVNSKGIVKSNGNLRHTPLKQKGTFELKDISLTELTPYLQEKAFVKVDDGRLSLKSKTEYSVSLKKPDLRVKGSLSIKEVFVNDSRDSSAVISFNELGLKSFTFEVSPNRLYIDEIDLNSFYVNAVIDEKKQMNLSKLVKPSDGNITSKEDVVVAVEAEDVNATKEVAFPVKILKMNVTLGNAHFADLSIPIKFQTNIHNLNGVIYSISNVPGETSYVNIDGEVNKYGSTKLKGSVNSANPKEYTDLEFSFKNLDLNSVSGYSASFAGHEIDSGKLFLDLGYDIRNSELIGSNEVIIKQIKLGREVEDENVTSLPLGFVIALLEDDEGIIEIDMPVEGNLDEPDFKYGALVMKTLGNLILKAVASPFKFLGSMMGLDGEALEYAEFEAGSFVVLPPQREKLDQIAKMMTKRPKIKLAFTPTYDEVLDKRAIQTEMLITLIVKESGIKNRKEHESAMNIDMLEDIYEDFKDDDTVDKLEEKLKKEYKDDKFERAYLSALFELCKDIQVVTKVNLENLAKMRAEAVVTYLVQDKNMAAVRVIENPLVVINEPEEKLVKQKLSIEVK